MLGELFGEWIKEKRLELGWTQKQMSEVSGIPQTTISGWETGKVEDMRYSNLVTLARLFNLRLCEIPLDGTNNRGTTCNSPPHTELIS